MKHLVLAGGLVGLATLVACNAPSPATPPFPPTATSAPPTLEPAATLPPTLESTLAATAAPLTDRVQIVLIALEDGGVSGPAVGCGDSAITVERQIASTDQPLQAALAELLSIKDPYYGESGLYNALSQSDLAVESVEIDANGLATVRLVGQIMLGGVCDNPRVEAQLEGTAMQLSTITAVEFFINDRPLDEVLSLR